MGSDNLLEVIRKLVFLRHKITDWSSLERVIKSKKVDFYIGEQNIEKNNTGNIRFGIKQNSKKIDFEWHFSENHFHISQKEKESNTARDDFRFIFQIYREDGNYLDNISYSDSLAWLEHISLMHFKEKNEDLILDQKFESKPDLLYLLDTSTDEQIKSLILKLDEKNLSLLKSVVAKIGNNHDLAERITHEILDYGIDELKLRLLLPLVRELYLQGLDEKDSKLFSKILSSLKTKNRISKINMESSHISSFINRLNDYENLRKLSLNPTDFFELDVEQLSTKLSENSYLNFLSLYTIGVKGVRHVAVALTKNKTLKVLKLNHVLLSEERKDKNIGQKLSHVLASNISANNTLKALYINSNQIGVEGSKEISKMLLENEGITHLYLSRNSLGEEGAGYIAKALEKNKTITHLDLSRNNIGPRGAKLIASALKVNTSLTHLDLSNNKIKNEGTIHIAEALMQNNNLILLDISDNSFEEKGISHLARSLKQNKSLRFLDISFNYIKEAHTPTSFLSPSESFLLEESKTILQSNVEELGLAFVFLSLMSIKKDKNFTSNVGEIYMRKIENNHIREKGQLENIRSKYPNMRIIEIESNFSSNIFFQRMNNLLY